MGLEKVHLGKGRTSIAFSAPNLSKRTMSHFLQTHLRGTLLTHMIKYFLGIPFVQCLNRSSSPVRFGLDNHKEHNAEVRHAWRILLDSVIPQFAKEWDKLFAANETRRLKYFQQNLPSYMHRAGIFLNNLFVKYLNCCNRHQSSSDGLCSIQLQKFWASVVHSSWNDCKVCQKRSWSLASLWNESTWSSGWGTELKNNLKLFSEFRCTFIFQSLIASYRNLIELRSEVTTTSF